MMLLLHIVVAVASLAVATAAAMVPSHSKLRVTYGLVAATLTSGTYLVLHMQAALVSACTTGLVYLAAVSALTVVAHRRLPD